MKLPYFQVTLKTVVGIKKDRFSLEAFGFRFVELVVSELTTVIS